MPRVLSLIILFAVCAVTNAADTSSPGEYQVKAAFLYNFAKFVEWPTEAFPATNTAIILCILGEDPFGIDLEQAVKGKTANGKELTIRRIKEVQELKICHILFISSSEKKRLSQILEVTKNSSILTVGEMDRFAKLGGIINFVIEENKVRFEINVDVAEQAGLKINSKLLKLARIVKKGFDKE